LCLLLMFAPVQPVLGQEPARPLYAPALISLGDARVIIEGAIAFARERNLSMAVVVMDHAGNVVSSDRMDGAPFRNVHEAEGKAYASALYGRPTKELGEFEATRPDRYFGIINMYPGKVYLVGGGLPLVVDSTLVGAVGIAGLPQGVGELAGQAAILGWARSRAIE
jgi:uncharacterized protein GlcG (DUF336 family)